IADNKFYVLSNQKVKFRRFGETFVEFFRMLSLTKAEHPLLKNENPKTGILVCTVEGSFLGKFNNAIIRRATEEKEQFPDSTFIAVGEKAVDPLSKIEPEMESFTGMDNVGMYEMAIEVKDYLVKEIMEGRLGKVVVVYSWPKTQETQATRVVKLLPCDELITKQTQFVKEFENIIEESEPYDIIGFLANLWITTRLYEIFYDLSIAGAAAQSQFLDDSLDKMKKERTKSRMKYMKAKKSDIDKGLRETFSARLIAKGADSH
ncbi:MAG: F0F1 ATP synthase subunit gamma, partial [Candidatus Omnitrophica bacterium]|nr:F0F1 ATP synthase subunit gamma [Candidatus Omnitrophota bacterium]